MQTHGEMVVKGMITKVSIASAAVRCDDRSCGRPAWDSPRRSPTFAMSRRARIAAMNPKCEKETIMPELILTLFIVLVPLGECASAASVSTNGSAARRRQPDPYICQTETEPMARTDRDTAIEEMLETVEEAMSQVIGYIGVDWPPPMKDAIEQFRTQLGAAIDSVEFVKRALNRQVHETDNGKGPP